MQWQEAQLQDNPWQMEQRVLTRLRNVFKLVQKEDWNDVTFTGQKNSLDEGITIRTMH